MENNKRLALPDIANGSYGVLLVSDRAWEVLRPMLMDAAEALPMKSRHGTYFGLNLLHILKAKDCLDLARSVLRYSSWGDLSGVDQFVFRDEFRPPAPLFVFRDGTAYEFLVTEEFKQVVEQHRLRGAVFRRPYPEQMPLPPVENAPAGRYEATPNQFGKLQETRLR